MYKKDCAGRIILSAIDSRLQAGSTRLLTWPGEILFDQFKLKAMNWFGGKMPRDEINSSIRHCFVCVLCLTILLGPALTHSNPYLAKPGEAPVSVYVSTCAVTGGFIHLYTALDQKIFEKYGIHVKHVVIQRR